MKLTVNLDLENDTMKTYQDIRDALKQIILSAGSCASLTLARQMATVERSWT